VNELSCLWFRSNDSVVLCGPAGCGILWAQTHEQEKASDSYSKIIGDIIMELLLLLLRINGHCLILLCVFLLAHWLAVHDENVGQGKPTVSARHKFPPSPLLCICTDRFDDILHISLHLPGLDRHTENTHSRLCPTWASPMSMCFLNL
jgi:hypothetical protein